MRKECGDSKLGSDKLRNAAFRRVILSIPKGKVATYGQVAAAAGYARYHRAVARFLHSERTDRVPWQRVVGAGGEIKLRYEKAAEQRLRLQIEGVTFRGRRVNLSLHQHSFVVPADKSPVPTGSRSRAGSKY